ncbi:MAG: hypothetical protein CMG57_08995 [Candidatus Marinimicrobia bacterium]|nr:hypothetical protein [Candidatus Neomarinimicrobiota bacterium]|tara:strand:+ start:129 stop:353 length:225 start_codon:yes stop_codon:yes gene_type:complete
MKKLYLFFILLLLIVITCDEGPPPEEELDTKPPTVSISLHSRGQTVKEIVTITVTTQYDTVINFIKSSDSFKFL